ncbi:MAG: hypothetical protein NZ518_06175, partial [Dehalococcoidia bacterium]|nr:hypothetical protein [Dehalococcoidia bacterium]
MVGVIALLDPEHSARVEALWRDLEQRFGLTEWRSAPWPGLTLHAARAYHDAAIRDGLKAACRGARPFVVRTTGVRVVRDPAPAVVVAVDLDPQLASI